MKQLNLIDQLTLAKTELIMAKQELSKANLLLDKVMHDLSHTIRQPLTSVLGLIDLVKSEGSMSSDFCEMMETSLFKLDANLRELQAYCDKSRKDVVVEKVNVGKLIHEQYRILAMEHDCASISLDLDVVEKNSFYTDSSLLSFILRNVLSNAIKFQDKNKKEKYIRILSHVDVGEFFIEIRDNGIGIHEKHLPGLCEIFFTADSVEQGVGLGLAISKECVIKLGGELTIRSKVNEGTSVTIQLPNGAVPLEN